MNLQHNDMAYRPWTLIETPRELRICTARPFDTTKCSGNAVSIGATALSFRPHRRGSHRGEKMVYEEFTKADREIAAFIVRACNAHEALVKAAQNLLAYLGDDFQYKREDALRDALELAGK